MKTAVLAIIRRQTSVLIVKRGDTAPWMPGKWSLVGGVVEEGEDPKTAAMRECFEETRIRLGHVEEIDSFWSEGWDYHIFRAWDEHQTPRLDYENVSFHWVTLGELNRFAFVPMAREIIERVLR